MKKFVDKCNVNYYFVKTKENSYLIEEYKSGTGEFFHRLEVKGIKNIVNFIINNGLEEVENGRKVEFNFRKTNKNRRHFK